MPYKYRSKELDDPHIPVNMKHGCCIHSPHCKDLQNIEPGRPGGSCCTFTPKAVGLVPMPKLTSCKQQDRTAQLIGNRREQAAGRSHNFSYTVDGYLDRERFFAESFVKGQSLFYRFGNRSLPVKRPNTCHGVSRRLLSSFPLSLLLRSSFVKH